MGETLQFVVFRVGSQNFCLEIHSVIEVIATGFITPVPGGPTIIEGMIDVRGRLVPVVDLRKRLGMASLTKPAQSRILIVRSGKDRTGLIVDEADQVCTVPVESIQPPPEPGSRFVLAVASVENTPFLILDLERLFSTEERNGGDSDQTNNLRRLQVPLPK